MSDLPTGTVTFLFTDVEASTKLLHELGPEGYAVALGEHRRVLRDAFTRHGGVEVDTQGDAFFVAFPTAPGALDAAREARDALASQPIRVRMGIHTGTPHLAEEGYVGADVHRAARIAAAGHGGQVLVSSTAASLVKSDGLRDLGEHRLKDLSAPERIYQLGDGDFPPLKTLHRTNLPFQATPLVGRERELEEAGAVLRSHRLVTLTGPGGTGKTRLALQLAAEGVQDFPDGVFWVPLQALRDPALVQSAIAASVGADDGLLEHVGDKRLLVLLDNFEQVIEAAPAVSSLLAGTPNAKMLVTSREPLHVQFEQCYPVEPLPEDDATVLFVERAAAVARGFRETAAVREICRRLDGLPLAIELAAARVALLDPDALLERLERRLPLLESRSRDAPERQRTLRAAIEWSYELLSPGEQELFRALSVFQGSFSLDAAEAVCGADVDVVESLVVKSLVRRWDSGRLGMLETIREYALERLAESPEVEDVRRRHADFFLAVAKSANLDAGRMTPGGQRLARVIVDQDNIRAALTWALQSGSVAFGLELATATEFLWVAEDPHEGVRWFTALLEHPEVEAVPPETLAHALRACGSSTDIAGDDERARTLYERSLALFEAIADDHGRGELLHRLGIQAMRRGDVERARQLVEKAHEIFEREEDDWVRTWGHMQTTGTLGAIARDAGEEERALVLIGESARLARQTEVMWWEAGMLAEQAALALNRGRVEEAESSARGSLALAAQIGDRSGRVFGVGLLAAIAAERGCLERAGRLWGAIEDEEAVSPLGGWRRHRATREARIRELADADFERGRAAGHELSLDDAVEYALAEN